MYQDGFYTLDSGLVVYNWSESRGMGAWENCAEPVANLEDLLTAAKNLQALRQEVAQLLAVIDAHEIDSIDCDRRGVDHCDCLQTQVNRVQAILKNES